MASYHYCSGFRRLVATLMGLAGAGLVVTAQPAMRVIRDSATGTESLKNGDFELVTRGNLEAWTASPKGFRLVRGEGRSGSTGLGCESPDRSGWYGASQSLLLNQTNALPLVLRGWSKAIDVSGTSDSDYSLYVDITYNDGTPLWGQTANFHTGAHDWERRELTILPDKPIKALTVYCLFRNHSGRVWFDDVSLTELKTDGPAVLFQGAQILTSGEKHTVSANTIPAQQIRTTDGLNLNIQNHRIASFRVDGTELTTGGPSGFLVRDVATDSDIYGFKEGVCQELGFKLDASYRAESDYISIQGRLSSLRGQDRAVTLVFALPVDASGWRWWDDIHHARTIAGRSEFSKLVSVQCGATGTMSLYPLAAICDQAHGLALALDMAHPAQYRLAYHPGTQQFLIAYDFGLVNETQPVPESASFRFVLYRFDPKWGFRAAFQKLMGIFPDYFKVRSRDQGIWMPFTDVSRVQGWQDFGFKYHEGNNHPEWDDAHDVLSFRYTEPMTWWMRMPDQAPRTVADAIQIRDSLSHSTKSEQAMAAVSQVAAMWDETGQPGLLFRDEPWCHGAVWSLNPNPYLPTLTSTESTTAADSKVGRFNAATVHWNNAIKEQLYGQGLKVHLDGEYLDSLEGYVTANLNFRREHFRYSTVPLTFASDTEQPALFKGLAVFEFTHWFCDEIHRLGKLTFANGVPYRFTFLCPWLDILGTETDWLRQGHYAPASHEQMSLWRTMSGAKPYLLLMNADYDAFTPVMVEQYFQRSLFYGMFPSMFSHNAAENPYWENPKWYNRDRALFKRYLPIIKRVAEAGWQPVTEADTSNPRILVERFGPDSAGKIYFTLFNDADTGQRCAIRLDKAALGLQGSLPLKELLSDRVYDSDQPPEIDLAPQQAAVLAVESKR